MCGITGYVGTGKASKYVFEGLKKLEYRGYDSCGIAAIDDIIRVKKDTGMIDEIEERINLSELPGCIAIGHTRWATHGSVTVENAHPHLDCSGTIAVVHNGIISNYKELRKELEKKHRFTSDTDTEVLVHIIEENYKQNLEEAVINTLKRIRGTYALLVISSEEPDRIIVARKESPLLIGLGDGGNFVGSDVSAFLAHSRKAIPLDDDEYAVITGNSVEVKSIITGRKLDKDILKIELTEKAAMKEGYPYFMLKEIHEQPSTITSAQNIYPEDIRAVAEAMQKAEKIYLTGAGTSLHACEVAEYWFSKIAGKLVVAVDSSELENRAVVDNKTLVIGVTQSGETYDTLSAMRFAKKRGAELGVIVNVIGSTATRFAEYVIMQSSGMEVSVAATKTYTSQLSVLLRLAIELAKLEGKDVKVIEEEFGSIPDKMGQVLSIEDEIKGKADSFFNVSNYLFIGKGINTPTAEEAALKLKEITYLHAEGMSAGLLKHGTISLIDENMSTVAFLPSDSENRAKMLSNIQEVSARDGRVLIVSQGKVDEDEVISLPYTSELLSPFIFSPVFQLLAYYVAVKLGRNVDKPRALAKCVTVE